jgi:protein-S-isoprenylcysteine O-methyltransferase Ste14
MLSLLPHSAAAFAYLAVAFTLVFVWPTLRLKLATGVNAIVLPAGDTADAFVGRWFKATMAGLFLMTGLTAALPDAAPALGAIALPWPEIRLIAGWAVLGAALVWVFVAQVQMGASWRIGIDKRPTELRANGLFARSRNPIFLGMRMMLLGLFLVMPTGWSLTFLMLGEVLMQLQVRFEEAHLARLHGETYRAYVARVPRWI